MLFDKPRKADVIVLLIVALGISCTKEKIIIEEVEKEYSWEQHNDFLHERKLQTNSFASNSNLYTIGTDIFTTFKVDPSNIESIEIEYAVLYFNYPIQYRLPITSKVFAGVTSSSVGFYSTNNPLRQGADKWIKMENLDPTFATFDSPYYLLSECIGLNEMNQCLIPYLSYDTTSEFGNLLINEPNFYLINLVVNNELFGDYIDTLQAIKIEKNKDWGRVISIHAIGEHFFVTCSKKTLRIEVDGNFETSYDGILYRIFKYNNKLYSLSRDYIYESLDEGLNWILVNEIDPNLLNFNFRIVDNNLIGYFESQLFHFQIKNEGFTDVKELVNDGIEGNEITSISILGDKVYLTTLSGMFTKRKEDFLSYK